MKDFARKNNPGLKRTADTPQLLTALSIMLKIEPDSKRILTILNFSTNRLELTEAVTCIPFVSDKITIENLWISAAGALQAWAMEIRGKYDPQLDKTVSLLPDSRRNELTCAIAGMRSAAENIAKQQSV